MNTIQQLRDQLEELYHTLSYMEPETFEEEEEAGRLLVQLAETEEALEEALAKETKTA